MSAAATGVYEVDLNASSQVTKKTSYYPAGGAMRVEVVGVSNTLYYMLRDHLGSASVTLDASGNVAANGEQRYYPFGESRITSAALPTDRLFTGQREIAELGLYHYGARFYLPKMGRFISADSIVPNFANPQSLNRFAYGYNNPVKYIDPTGHTAICGVECEEELDSHWSAPLSSYGVVTTGLTSLEQLAIIAAVQDVGQQLADTTPWLETPAEAFQETYGLDSGNQMEFARCPTGSCTALGWTINSGLVWFNYFIYSQTDHPDDWRERSVHVVVHEMGHAFNGRMTNVLGDLAATQSPYNQLTTTQTFNAAFPNRVDDDNRLVGFTGPRYNWQQSPSGTPGEEFADQFVGWTYNGWEIGPNGQLSDDGQARAGWMAARMPLWVNMATASEEGAR